MGRWCKDKAIEQREHFRKLLQMNLPREEIKMNLGVSNLTLDRLFAEANEYNWDELATWKPKYQVYECSTLSDKIVDQMCIASKRERQNFKFIISEVTGDAVKLTIFDNGH